MGDILIVTAFIITSEIIAFFQILKSEKKLVCILEKMGFLGLHCLELSSGE